MRISPQFPGLKSSICSSDWFFRSILSGQAQVQINMDGAGRRVSRRFCTRCILSALDGNEAALTHVRVQREAGVETIGTRYLFPFIVADLKADWMGLDGVERDKHNSLLKRSERGPLEAAERYAL
jgi:thioredoxin reductase (NADPH)